MSQQPVTAADLAAQLEERSRELHLCFVGYGGHPQRDWKQCIAVNCVADQKLLARWREQYEVAQ